MADPNPCVRVNEVCKVAPQPQPKPSSPADSSATPPPHSLPLTFFDIPWLRFPAIQRLFFYEIENTSSNFNDSTFFDSILIPKLKASLSAALQQFLPLAGNITWPLDSHKPILTYVDGDAVSVTIAQSDHPAQYFYHLVSTNNFDIEAKEYHPLVPQLSVSHDKASAMALQVTIFPNSRGFSIGTSMHHAVQDGKTSTMFVKSWAHICKHGGESNYSVLPDQLKPFYDRSVIVDPAGMGESFSNQLLNMDSDRPNNRSLMVDKSRDSLVPSADTVRGTFQITPSQIEALRQLVKEKQQPHDHQSVQYLSTFCVICAHTWVCLVKAEEIKSDKATFKFAVDCRSRLNPPLPATYFGNCLSGCYVVAETKGLLGEDGLLVAANAISEAIKNLDVNMMWNNLAVMVRKRTRMRLGPVNTSDHERELSISGSPRFEIYDTDFGWGRPKKAEVVTIDQTGAMSLSDVKEGAAAGGVEVGLVMKKHHMQVFASLFAQSLGKPLKPIQQH